MLRPSLGLDVHVHISARIPIHMQVAVQNIVSTIVYHRFHYSLDSITNLNSNANEHGREYEYECPKLMVA